MKAITLQDLKERKLNPKTADRMERTWELSDHNKMVYRYRMEKGDIDSCTFDMTHNGNDPKSNEQMLDDARCYYEQHVYTDEEWERYFLPAINEMIAYNDSFVRWMPGYVIRHKQTGIVSIVEYDYALGFGGRDYTSLSVVDLNSDGSISHSWAWAHYEQYELIDKDHTEENIAKILAYHKERGHDVPYYLSQELSRMLYEKDTREAPSRT